MTRRTEASRVLTLAYLQVGPPEHGICRYGRLLAAEGRRRKDVRVLEDNVTLVEQPRENRRFLRAAARELSRADLVHLQVSIWSDGSWGAAWRAVINLRTFRCHCRTRIVVTLHDVNGLRSLRWDTPLRWLCRIPYQVAKGLLRPPVRLLRQIARGRLAPAQLFTELWTLEPEYPCLVAHQAARMARKIFTLTESEREVLECLGLAPETVLIPHFVEDVAASSSSVAFRRSPAKTVVVAGFLTRSKGHNLILEAMRLLPEVTVVFLGGPSLESGASRYYAELMAAAHGAGVQHRLEVTGYLPDDEYYARVAAADLAVCPFQEDKSASGSLSSVIAAGTPILAADIPLIAEYNTMVPRAIPTFAPNVPEALAGAIRTLLAMPRGDLTRPLRTLRQKLSLSTIYDRHLETYRELLEGPPR